MIRKRIPGVRFAELIFSIDLHQTKPHKTAGLHCTERAERDLRNCFAAITYRSVKLGGIPIPPIPLPLSLLA
jgi:hypothetical protein